MRIIKLYVLNCGIFSKILIDFTQKNQPQELICLSGVNGSGKTTIMDLIIALASFLNPQISIQNIFFDRLKPNILTRTEFAQLDILIDNKILSLVLGDEKYIQYNNDYPQAFMIVNNDIKSIIKQFEDIIVKKPVDKQDKRSIEIEELKDLKGFLTNNDSIIQKIIKKNLNLFDNLLKNLEKNIYKELDLNTRCKLPHFYLFNSHDREILDIRYSSIPKDDSRYKIVYKYNPHNDDLKKLLIFYDYAYPKEYNALIKWINTNVLIGKKIERIDRPNFRVIIKTNQGQEHVLELLSSGEESLLIIAIQLYLKASLNSVIMIDEVDQSLHPEFQEKIMEIIIKIQKEKKCQIIISSHSVNIWRAFKDEAIIRLTEVVK
ncbi:AAA ATPase-like domain-containing protein [Desulfonema limicola]|uniref:AAA ATPase-like domain-containing protein n=1 Tax=Desulfonema limicola TaxID=45656 RepID=A0A975BBI9_9BACT|nr:AAA family ATPase [Desulfonema limicola]QTA82209.1 AAA ATPase-like domain-containing protein [Desulfonema limicola]